MSAYTSRLDPTGPGDEAYKPVHEAVLEWVTEVTDSLASDALLSRVEEIEWRAYDGFMPHTAGGWRGVIYNDLYHGGLPKIIEPYLEQDQKMCADQFLSDREIELPEGTDLWAWIGEQPAEVREAWEQFSSEWEQNDGDSPWFVYVKAYYFAAGSYGNDTGEDEVFFALTVNDDFGYGRESVPWLGKPVDHEVWTSTVPVADLHGTPTAEEKFEQLRDELFKAWREC
jgi:hypothetical protein